MQPILASSLALIEKLRAALQCPEFLRRHRRDAAAFTRRRRLPFASVVLLVLQKSLKSLQLRLHEFCARLAEGAPWRSLTPGAWTQARAKLRHTAFVELNSAVVLAEAYAPERATARWRGLRLLAIDSSTLRLPDKEALFAHFGGQTPSNGAGACGGRVPQARLSVLYDCLERLGLEARVGGFAESELALGAAHLAQVGAGDLVLLDRGYCGYEFFARIAARGADFLGRCPRRSFAPVQALFARDEAGVSVAVRLAAPKAERARLEREGLPVEWSLRLVCVRLSTGELEVLATSLEDPAAWPVGIFRELYGMRWGIETYYHQLKSTLDLENWSGHTVEAILQDTHAAVFLSNLQSVLTREAAAQLPQAGAGRRRHTAQLNRAVCFHALKTRAIELLLGPTPAAEVLSHLRALFVANPVSVRASRRPPRPPPSPLRSHHFQKRIRKIVF